MSASAQTCDAPHYRWPEKTSTALLGSPSRSVSIGAMLGWRAPNIGPGPAFWCAPRTGAEQQVLTVLGWVRRLDKTKDDGDWHIELTENRRDPVTACIVAEIPLADLHPAFRTARASLDSALAQTRMNRRGDLGAFGLADGGRVFRAGEHSDVWHSALGGGLWASFLGRSNTLSVSYARGREGGGIYFRSGLLF